ncbi:MAG: ABC transporter permease, partial [Rubrivivax sp.]|nr:ABC transporter permease [Rubrivivax sp.]
MARYIAKRLVGLIPTLVGALFLVFVLIHLAPGGPVLALLGPMASQQEIARTERALGLDRPLPEQFVTYAARVVQGDLGTSIRTGRPVLNSFMQRLPYTAQIVLLSILLSSLIAIPVGVLVGIKNRSRLDSATSIAVLVAVSVPNFWLALLLVLVFAVWRPILPLYGMPLITQDLGGALAAALLPAIAMGAYHAATLSRTLRGEMIEVLSQGYVRLARGFGLPGWQIYLKYALKNALIPVITLLGLQVRYAFGAAAVIETVFAVPGVGQLLVTGILARDYPLVQGTILMLAVIFTGVNLIVDVAYAYADP